MAIYFPLSNPSIQVGNFNGVGNGRLFLQKFHQLASLENWQEEEKLLRFMISLTGSAWTWFTSLPQNDRNTFRSVEKAFKKHYIDKYIETLSFYYLRHNFDF